MNRRVRFMCLVVPFTLSIWISSMAYSPSWTNGNGEGRLEGGVHDVKLSDAQEIVDAINRRRLLTFQTEKDYSSSIISGAYVKDVTMDTWPSPPYQSLRNAIEADVLHPPIKIMGGTPPSPTNMQWLWPVSDGDEDKIIIGGSVSPDAEEVSLRDKLNGTNQWTDAVTDQPTPIRAIHWNELRQATEWIRRGRMELPLYMSVGLFSPAPDTPWTGGGIANDGADELRAVADILSRILPAEPRGLTGVTVRSSSFIELTAEDDCTAKIYHCLRAIDFVDDEPTWNDYAPIAGKSWGTAGGLGGGDATLIGSITLLAGQPNTLSSSGLTSALQNIVNGAEQNFIVTRVDTGPFGIAIEGRAVIDFDLHSPPN